MHQRTEYRGFTLIEILVVILLISIIVGVTMLSPRSSGPAQALQNETLRLQILMEQARDRALLEGDEYGLSIESGRYHWWRWSRNKEAWSMFEDANYQSYNLSKGLIIQVIKPSVSDQSLSGDQPLIVMFSDGQISPFQLVFTMENDRQQEMVLESDGFASIFTP